MRKRRLHRWRLTLHPNFNVVCLNVLTACLTTYKELRNTKTDVSLEVRKFKILSEINRPKGDFFLFLLPKITSPHTNTGNRTLGVLVAILASEDEESYVSA